MAFILSADGRDVNGIVRMFERYRAYLQSVRGAFPPSAFDLATSDWYFDPGDHRCPHDAWLEGVEVREHASGVRHEMRSLSLRIRLLGAYHDGHIELQYPKVSSYAFGSVDSDRGHGDWLCDELRLSERGKLIHEIEWSRGGTWSIEASDVELTWIPRAEALQKS